MGPSVLVGDHSLCGPSDVDNGGIWREYVLFGAVTSRLARQSMVSAGSVERSPLTRT